jgi:dipeptidase
MKKIVLFLLFGSLVSLQISACTNFLVTKGASSDGSTFITYAADSHVLYGELYYSPAARYLPGTMLDIYEWDTGKYLGQIEQVEETYSVVGNMNEYQVSIGETTYGGRHELEDPKGVLDYGSLMYIALQRAKTARQAIEIMGQLVAEYGYYSSGESFSVADSNEVWIMEIIGKGPENKGAVWVALKIPDGYICGHANQSRIGTFPLKDPENCLYAEDVISFARDKGFFEGKDKTFSFAKAYAPLDFGALRFCEARVYAMFHRAAPSLKLDEKYVMGDPDATPLPLWIKPDEKLSVHDVMSLMRDHFEGTSMDMTKDIGAGPFALPYRWRPLTWKLDGVEYCNERATSTQQTGFSFVAQGRNWLPNPIGGVFWFGVDDTASTVYVPMYCGLREAPYAFRVGNGDFNHFTWDSAFWMFNFVSNYTYLRYSDMIIEVQKVQNQLEGSFLAMQKATDEAALSLYKQAPERARTYLTEYSAKQTEKTMLAWKKLGEHLMVKFLDGNVKDELGNVTHPRYPDDWYKKIVDQHGEVIKMKEFSKNPH